MDRSVHFWIIIFLKNLNLEVLPWFSRELSSETTLKLATSEISWLTDWQHIPLDCSKRCQNDLFFSLFPCIWTRFLVSREAKQPNNTTLPPPWITVGTVLPSLNKNSIHIANSWNSVSLHRQTYFQCPFACFTCSQKLMVAVCISNHNEPWHQQPLKY